MNCPYRDRSVMNESILKIITFLLFLNGVAHAQDLGPVGPQTTPPSLEGETEDTSSKQVYDLPYKPSVSNESTNNSDAGRDNPRIVPTDSKPIEPIDPVLVYLPSKSPEPVGALDPVM
ncbi:MAG: hypothetical protein A2048_00980 [Deltaproteobacteria bacterium GWA2_45_12]|nr:MAG: hypothetical protein A2048_00980 [Deltaproteobacteria bacterium GWA2_45_12]